jgi:hypothetical protein
MTRRFAANGRLMETSISIRSSVFRQSVRETRGLDVAADMNPVPAELSANTPSPMPRFPYSRALVSIPKDINEAALMDRRVNPRCRRLGKLIVSDRYSAFLTVCVLFAMAVTVARAANPLPAITVTGKATPTPAGDTISRDWAQRSPEVHWPTPMFNGAAEIFTHNQIVINASCDTVWDRLVHAELWPHWCPYSGKVTIWGGSQVLQKNTKFTWVSSDVPQYIAPYQMPADRVDGLVIECVPPNRLGWRSYGRQWTIHGPLIASYHNWFIKPMGPKKCLVTFEEIATGRAALYARAAYPEFVHITHDHWLEGLKRISEARSWNIAKSGDNENK